MTSCPFCPLMCCVPWIRPAVLCEILLALPRPQLHRAVEQIANLLPAFRRHASPPRLISCRSQTRTVSH